MATTPYDENGAAPTGAATKEDLEAEIERTRAELGATVEELTNRLDVKARAKASATQAAGQAQAQVREKPAATIAVALALVSGIVGLVVWRRRR